MDRKLKYFTSLLAIVATSCMERYPDISETPVSWEFHITKAGEGTEGYSDKIATYRASLFKGSTLSSDGTYSGYYNSKGWLYPCKTDDAGYALDKDTGEVIDWNDSNWFGRTDTGSNNGLRANYNGNQTLVFTSPAVKMEQYAIDGKSTKVWGLPIDRRTSEWAVSKPSTVSTSGSYIGGKYIYNVSDLTSDNGQLLTEHRAKINVRVACGASSSAYIHSVYFNNVITSAYYNPISGEYDNYILDGNCSNPLDYYIPNTWPTEPGQGAGEGEKFVVPEGGSVMLKHKSGLGDDPTQWWTHFSDADEWKQGSSDEAYLLSAIRDFYILPLDYSIMDNLTYYYDEIMPQIVVRTGEEGQIKATINLAAEIEPMKEYNIYIFISNVFVSASLSVIPWDEHKHWTDQEEDTGEIKVTFGKTINLDGEITVIPWDNSPNSTTIKTDTGNESN